MFFVRLGIRLIGVRSAVVAGRPSWNLHGRLRHHEPRAKQRKEYKFAKHTIPLPGFRCNLSDAVWLGTQRSATGLRLIGNARQEKTRTKAFRGPWFLIGSQRLSHASA